MHICSETGKVTVQLTLEESPRFVQDEIYYFPSTKVSRFPKFYSSLSTQSEILALSSTQLRNSKLDWYKLVSNY